MKTARKMLTRPKLGFKKRIPVSVLISCVSATIVIMACAVNVESAGNPAIEVTVIADGQEWNYVSTGATVGDVLQEAGVLLGPLDRVQPKLRVKATQGMRIRVTRVVQKEVIQSEPVAFDTRIKLDLAAKAEYTVLQKGQPGEKRVKYLITYKDNVKTTSKVLESTLIRPPIDEILAVSPSWRPTHLTSRSGRQIRCIRMLATAYAPFVCGGSASGRAACGMPAGKGVVAVDPRVIPLRTQLYVEGYGLCIAGDVGGAIKGTRIDLGFDTYREAVRFGKRYVNVYILD